MLQWNPSCEEWMIHHAKFCGMAVKKLVTLFSIVHCILFLKLFLTYVRHH